VDSHLRLLLGVAATIVALIAYGRWRIHINSWVAKAVKWLYRIALDHKTCKVAETFFTEAAVLWFVFPILDSIYEHRVLSDPLLRQAYVAAIFCLLAAILLSHMGKED
jgi:hypothetical protein